MSNLSKSPFTKTLTSEILSFTNNDGFNSISILIISGTVTLLGASRVGATEPGPITLSTSGVPGLTVLSDNGIRDFTIDATAGSCAVIAT